MPINNRFFFRILLPSLFAMLVFFIALYLFVLPKYRESLMDKKRETIRELTNTAWSIMQKQHSRVNIDFSQQAARLEAARLINDLRYGPQMKDYFWINDTTPVMVAHPYLPQMVGTNLEAFRDKQGNNLFLDIVEVVEEHGEGFVEYYWQWKDDTLTIAPKLSFVKLFEPWGWIVGTGIYIDDVNREIALITRNIFWISVAISLLIASTLGYLARRNFLAERQRTAAQEKLREAMERYKKLVDASSDGVMMVWEKEIVYCNPFLLQMLNFQSIDFENKNDALFSILNTLIQDFPKDHNADSYDRLAHPHAIDKTILSKSGKCVDVIVSKSEFEREGKRGHIYGIKDVSQHKTVERELGLSLEKLKAAKGDQTPGMFKCTVGRKPQIIDADAIALQFLGFVSLDELRKVHIGDLFVDHEQKKEVFNVINDGYSIKGRIISVKRADENIFNALVSISPIFDQSGNIAFCEGTIVEAYDYLGLLPAFNEPMLNSPAFTPSLLLPLGRFGMSMPKCHYQLPVSVAIDALAASERDILLVCGDLDEPLGIVTHKDLLNKVVARKMSLHDPIGSVMNSPLIVMMHYDLAFAAIGEMHRNNNSVVIIKSDAEATFQYTTLSILYETFKDLPEVVLQAIKNSRSSFEIYQNAGKLPSIIAPLVNLGGGVDICGKIISQFSDTITTVLIEQAISEFGKPPCPFVFLALGSEGRREQTLAADQDNAIVYQASNLIDPEMAKEYFLKLGNRVCNALAKSGFPLCLGGVMAKNDNWCKEFNEMQTLISSWINNPNPKEILNICIFFDFRPVYGEFSIAEDLWKICRSQLKQKSVFFYNLAEMVAAIHVPNPDAMRYPESYPIKSPGFALTNIVRLRSLALGINQRNTLERMEMLKQLGAISPVVKEDWEQSLNTVNYLRLKNQINQIGHNINANNEIWVSDLSTTSKHLLKKACDVIVEMQHQVRADFRIH